VSLPSDPSISKPTIFHLRYPSAIKWNTIVVSRMWCCLTAPDRPSSVDSTIQPRLLFNSEHSLSASIAPTTDLYSIGSQFKWTVGGSVAHQFGDVPNGRLYSTEQGWLRYSIADAFSWAVTLLKVALHVYDCFTDHPSQRDTYAVWLLFRSSKFWIS